MDAIDGVLLDIDGVLTLSWEPLPGAIPAVEWLRAEGIPFRLITNTTTHTRTDLARTLCDAGVLVEPREIVTAVVATGSYLRAHHAGARVFLLSDGDAAEDLEGVRLVGDAPDVVVLGGACDDFTYEAMNRIFGMLMDGATLVGMHRNLYWRTNEGFQLDAGAYIAGLEEATGRKALICGKPSGVYFEEALRMLGTTAERTAMVGDDIVNDVLGAQAVGITGVLVKTGKFLPGDLEKGEPDRVVSSVAELPSLLRPAAV
jgi:HAD superfamily hydrolase (TIGR01458 family)